MYQVDITADLNDEDETGFVWTVLMRLATLTRLPRVRLSWPVTRKLQPCGRSRARRRRHDRPSPAPS
jgi:hypothetical protein